ncbi:hypothetical protein [Ruminococcus flavefaciens]|uniref:hypothetical protein n=1 Tax=Ruminococcus flavefaciens TaxID=1265 RepID=UPI0026EF52CB|nr:hypothetical protein [Ruminococcus flavefaciens]
MAKLQQELIDRTESGTNYDDLAEEILRLRELQEQTVMDDAAKAAHRQRIQELLNFINSQPRTITEFDEALVKKLLEKVTVHDDYLELPVPCVTPS